MLSSVLVGLFSIATNAAVPVVKADGSSTVFPITEAVAEEFQNEQKGKVRVTVGISGTGGGFKKFCRGETDIQNASRPISSSAKAGETSEVENCKKAGINFIELPVAYDATVVVVNPKNTWLSEISVEDLKKIWEPAAQGKILKWNQVNASWPNEEMKLYGAGSDSGTFDYFTEAIVGKSKSSRGDYTASEDDNTLVQGVSKDRNAIGYLPLAYYEENKSKLKALAIIGGPKAPVTTAVLPSIETVKDGTYFPLSRPIFVYVSSKAWERTEVQAFVKFYLDQAGDQTQGGKTVQGLVSQAKYIPLPKEAYDFGHQLLKQKKYGTIFGGHSEVGLKITDLIAKEHGNKSGQKGSVGKESKSKK